MIDISIIWSEILNIITKKTSTVSYEMWFMKLQPYSINNGVLILISPLKNVKEILYTSDYKNILPESIKELNNPNINDYLIIMPDEVSKLNTIEIKKDYKEEESIYNNNLNKNYTFDNLVVGESNRIAKAAAFAVAENPGKEYNPLFIYGGVGLGKTHIINAIGNKIIENNSNIKIIYASTEQFVNDYIDSIRNNKNNDQSFKFREKYRNADILMLDDVQFLRGRDSSQEAVFHTINDLYLLKKQIILTSDRHPSELTFLEDRLRSRFQQGLNVSISSPDFETRVAIIQKKSFEKSFVFSKDIINFLAENITSNIREIEGALSKVIFYCKMNNKESADDLLLVKEALREELGGSNNIISLDTITDAVCSYFNVSKEAIKGNKKNKNIVRPRQIAVYLINEELAVPLISIGAYFGGRDHTTIIYARDKISEELKSDNLLKKQVNDIKNLIHRN